MLELLFNFVKIMTLEWNKIKLIVTHNLIILAGAGIALDLANIELDYVWIMHKSSTDYVWIMY